MSYTIPQTQKDFLIDPTRSPNATTFKYEYKHTANSNSTQTVTNPNVYAIPCVISINAGSGDTNTSGYESEKKFTGRNNYYKELYTYAGRTGVSISVKLNNKILCTAGGGTGTQSYLVAGKNGYEYKGKGDGHSWEDNYWSYNANNGKNNRQGGESTVYIVTIPPKGVLHIVFTYNNASNAPFKGSACVSGWY